MFALLGPIRLALFHHLAEAAFGSKADVVLVFILRDN
jgi:hypothetical protein